MVPTDSRVHPDRTESRELQVKMDSPGRRGKMGRMVKMVRRARMHPFRSSPPGKAFLPKASRKMLKALPS